MAATGKVCTGFSLPYVALYGAASGVPTYTKGQKLARGVNVSINPEASDDTPFYADNIASEVSPGRFTGGTVELTVDGLHQDAERLIMGLPEPDSMTVGEKTVNVIKYGDNATIPYVGVGFIARYRSDGIDTFVPVVLRKARFQVPGTEAATEEESISYQTQSLTATLMRDDSAQHDWKWIAEDQATEAEAEAVLKAFLNITEPAPAEV